MSNTNETPAEDAPVAGEGGNENGEDEFELDKDGKPVLGEDGKPKPKSSDGEGKPRRPAETPEAKRARLTRELEQHNKKHPVSVEAKPEDGEGKKDGLDYAQMAYLTSLGIKEDDEQALAATIVKETGKELKDVVKSAYFKSELKALQDANAAADAIPSSKRNGQPRTDSVEYWVAKGELPPETAENRDLRRKVVAAKSKAASDGKKFSDTSVVS